MSNLEPICQELNPLKTTISACSMLFIVIKMTFSENWVNSRHLLMSYWYLYYFHSIFFQLLSEVNSFIFYSWIAQRSFEMQVTSKNCYWNKRLILLLLQCTMDGKNCRRSLKMQRWVCLLAAAGTGSKLSLHTGLGSNSIVDWVGVVGTIQLVGWVGF